MLSSSALSSFCRQFSRACSTSFPITTAASASAPSAAVGRSPITVVSSSSSPMLITGRSSTMAATTTTTTTIVGSLSSSQHYFSSLATATTTSSQSKDNNYNNNKNEFVAVLKLNMLQDNPGAVKKKRRIGRGIGSSKGKTSGRGHKGQKARSGGSIPLSFEGGQTRFFKLLPKRGFSNKRHKTDMVGVNLGTIQDYVDMGRLVPMTDGRCWTMKDLLDAGICTASSVKNGIKLLAKGKDRLTTPIHIEISRASEEAIQAVESMGGEVTTVHYNKLALRALLKPHKFVKKLKGRKRGGLGGGGNNTPDDDYDSSDESLVVLPKFARPPPKWQPYYTNWETHRGYLSVQAQMRKLLKKRPELEDRFVEALKERNQTM